MKKVWVFILGMLTGVVVTIVTAAFFYAVFALLSYSDDSELNIFDRPGDCLIENSALEVFQVLDDNAALTMPPGAYEYTVYLLMNNEGVSYYDDQVVKLPTGKCFRQIGTYHYETAADTWKTVPVVEIL